MGKRKANVFIVAESVNNWFEASCHIPVATEAAKEESTQGDTGLGITTPSIPTPIAAISAEVDRSVPLPLQLTADPNCCVKDSPRGGGPADVAAPPRTSGVSIPVTHTSEELGPEREAAIQAFWALLAEAG